MNLMQWILPNDRSIVLFYAHDLRGQLTFDFDGNGIHSFSILFPLNVQRSIKIIFPRKIKMKPTIEDKYLANNPWFHIKLGIQTFPEYAV